MLVWTAAWPLPEAAIGKAAIEGKAPYDEAPTIFPFRFTELSAESRLVSPGSAGACIAEASGDVAVNSPQRAGPSTDVLQPTGSYVQANSVKRSRTFPRPMHVQDPLGP